MGLDEAVMIDPASGNPDDPEPLPSTSGLNICSSERQIDSDIGEQSDISDDEVHPMGDDAFIRRSVHVRRQPFRRRARTRPRLYCQ